MPIVLQNTTQATKSATTGTTLAAAVTPTAGNFLILGVSVSGGTLNSIASIADTKANTFTRVASVNDATAGTIDCELWTAPVTAGGSDTITLTITGSHYCNVWVREYSGLAATPLDKFVSAKGTGTALSSGATATLSQADELVIGFGGTVDGGETYTAGSGFGNLVQAQIGAGTYDTAMEDKIVSATTAQTAAFTASISDAWACIAATFKAAAAPSGPPESPTFTRQAQMRASLR
ncbi:hypothetical protein [Pseudonocardia sp. T1-2H]|uniref:hypothetical protein n=1 Tax=Pseudonocardia sp. T1-2H TaxID=3128899 RepID=UPI00310169A1